MIYVTGTQVTFIAAVFLGPLNYRMSLCARWGGGIIERDFNIRVISLLAFIYLPVTLRVLRPGDLDVSISYQVTLTRLTYNIALFSHPCILVTTI